MNYVITCSTPDSKNSDQISVIYVALDDKKRRSGELYRPDLPGHTLPHTHAPNDLIHIIYLADRPMAWPEALRPRPAHRHTSDL